MTPLAEGIETRGELAFLPRTAAASAQGFLFARPVPADEIPALTREGGLTLRLRIRRPTSDRS